MAACLKSVSHTCELGRAGAAISCSVSLAEALLDLGAAGQPGTGAGWPRVAKALFWCSGVFSSIASLDEAINFIFPSSYPQGLQSRFCPGHRGKPHVYGATRRDLGWCQLPEVSPVAVSYLLSSCFPVSFPGNSLFFNFSLCNPSVYTRL